MGRLRWSIPKKKIFSSYKLQFISSLGKAVTTYAKKYDTFSRLFNIANQLLTCHLPFAPLSQVYKWWQSPHHSQSKVVCRNFFGLWLLKTKKFVLLTDSDIQTRLKGKENKNAKIKTESYVFSGFGNGISRGWERKSTFGRFATDWFWPCTWKISFVGKD